MPARQFDGRRLRAVRRAADITQAGIAAALSVSQASVAAWESGKSSPDPDKLPALAHRLGEDLDELFPRAGAPDLADLRCDAGYAQRNVGPLIGTSRGPVQNAERAVRRLAPELAVRLAEVYGVTEETLLAAQARSFGELSADSTQQG